MSMEATAGLRFLRPYLCGLPPANKAVYARLFSASRIKARDPFQKRLRDQPSLRQRLSSKPSQMQRLSNKPSAVVARVQRLKELDALRWPRLESDPYRMTIPTFLDKFKLETAVPDPNLTTLRGRILRIRRSGSMLAFIDLVADYSHIQVKVHFDAMSPEKCTSTQFVKDLHPLRRGDIISVTGHAIRTSSQQLTLGAVQTPTILTPTLAPLPTELINEETKALNKHVDLLVNRQPSHILRLRSRITSYMRKFFDERHFLEVNTPILADSAGGAVARAFLTTSTALPQKKLAMRVAPELWLKRLVIGGNDRVFEIGPSFRNEGLDTTHNPEFTTCEFYSAYSNLADLIHFTEELFFELYNDVGRAVTESLESLPHPRDKFPQPKGPYKQVEFTPALEEALGFQIPNLSESDALNKLKTLLGQHHATMKIPPGITVNKLLDHLAGLYLENASLKEPVFIIHHPACMSPLSKSFTCPKTGQLVSARAELFIEGNEIANMYEEENNPIEQRRKFELQLRAKKAAVGPEREEGPAEIDESYVQALQHGLPPTGGWGCGIDRLVMLFSGASRIGDVIPFGSLKNVVSLSQDAKKKAQS
ncbi:hypothetical protein F4808DRAFT_452449 [Astrocystis sublimbata]|nr:hypothetical protein F4808DRAFT_452449 [Astrocystis sublimbata]